MPDISKGWKSRNSSRAKQANRGGVRYCGICRKCEILEARTIKRQLRVSVRDLREKCELMNLILITILGIRDQDSQELNLRAVEQKIKNPAFMRHNIKERNNLVWMVKEYRAVVGENADLQMEESDSEADFQEEDE